MLLLVPTQYSILLKSSLRVTVSMKVNNVHVLGLVLFFFFFCLFPGKPRQQQHPTRTVFVAAEFWDFLFKSNVWLSWQTERCWSLKSFWCLQLLLARTGVSCRCFMSEGLLKFQGIFVWFVIRSWISFVVASITAHSEGGEFHCSETNPSALLLISEVLSPQHINIGTWNRSEQGYDLLPLLAFFPPFLFLSKEAEKSVAKFPC